MSKCGKESEDGDDGDVLEEEDGEALFAGAGFSEAAFLQGLHHNGG